MDKTNRGFDYSSFTDLYGTECNLQKSSLATEEAIWLGVADAEPKIMASKAAANGVSTGETTGWVSYPIPEDVFINTRMHLNRVRAAALLPLLQRFVDTGDLT